MTRKVGLVPLLWTFLPALAGCGNPAGSADAGLPLIDPLQACIEVCSKSKTIPSCPYDVAAGPCEPWCAQILENAGPHCQDEVAAEWDCVARAVRAGKDHCHVVLPECIHYPADREWCVLRFGCTTEDRDFPSGAGCFSDALGPKQEVGCECDQVCVNEAYTSRCWTEGSTTRCECYQIADSTPTDANILLGICEGGPVCEPRLYKGCCNQFFKIPL